MLHRLGASGALAALGLFVSCTIKTPEEGSAGAPAVAPPEPSGAAGEGPAPEPVTPPASEPSKPPETDPCADCESGHCLDDGTCVECVPSRDDCPDGHYCTESNECVPGCARDESCASGVCLPSHHCQKCIDDRECASGFLCSAGECAPACTASQEGERAGCEGELTCCSERCADLSTDGKNCGACGNECESGQFCGLEACRDLTLESLCAVSKIVVILDTNKNSSDGNRVPGRAMGAALAEQCPTKPELVEAEQDSVEALNLTTGRPVSNSAELLVVAGGPFYQNLEGYLEEQRIAPIYWKVAEGAAEFRLSKNDELVASMPIAGDHESRDIFIIQLLRDPDSGSLILNAQGFWLSGTLAAAHFLTNDVLPQLSQHDKAWYAYEWTDLDGDKSPAIGELTLLDSGR